MEKAGETENLNSANPWKIIFVFLIKERSKNQPYFKVSSTHANVYNLLNNTHAFSLTFWNNKVPSQKVIPVLEKNASN